MNITIEKEDQYCVVTVGEEKLNTMYAPELKSKLVLLNSEDNINIIMNLENVKFVDSSGLSAILIANRLCTDSGGSFVIANVQDNVLKLIKISQLDNILNITSSLKEAVDYVMMEEIERDIEDDG